MAAAVAEAAADAILVGLPLAGGGVVVVVRVALVELAVVGGLGRPAGAVVVDVLSVGQAGPWHGRAVIDIVVGLAQQGELARREGAAIDRYLVERASEGPGASLRFDRPILSTSAALSALLAT